MGSKSKSGTSVRCPTRVRTIAHIGSSMLSQPRSAAQSAEPTLRGLPRRDLYLIPKVW